MKGKADKQNAFMFEPGQVVKQGSTWKLEHFKCEEDELLHFGKVASGIREKFLAQADSLRASSATDKKNEEDLIVEANVDLKRSYSRKSDTVNKLEKLGGYAECEIASRKKPLRKKDLTGELVEQVIHEVIVNKWKHAEVAVKFKIHRTLVARLVKSFKKDAGFVG